MEDMQDIFSSVDKTGEGVCVQASTLGSLEALLEFLKSDDVQIPVSTINIGPVHKKDVMRANIMIERKAKKFGVILAFDVPVTKEARELAEEMGVQIFTVRSASLAQFPTFQASHSSLPPPRPAGRHHLPPL